MTQQNPLSLHSLRGLGSTLARSSLARIGAMLTIALVICLGSTPQWAAAASARPLTLKDLASQSELILVGQVGQQQARKNAHGLILTDVEINPERVVKGRATVGTPLLVTHLGGIVGDIGLHVPGEVEFAEGEQAVLFLRRSARNDLRVVGMSQGKLPVIEEGGVNWVQIPRVLQLTTTAAELGQETDTGTSALRPSVGATDKDAADTADSQDATVIPVSGQQPLDSLIKAVQQLL